MSGDKIVCMRIGFIVEGDPDKAVVEALARRVLPAGVEFHTVRLGGKAALPMAYTSVLTLLAKSYDHVVVLFDTDSTLPESNAQQKEQVEESLREHGVADRTSVCPAVPTVRDWILGGRQDVGSHRIGIDELRDFAQRLDLQQLKERNSSFAEFARILTGVVQNVAA